MRLHRVELRHVRQFKELALELSAPLTIVGGPNGVGKSTLQKAILLALFHGTKKDRDSLVSCYDPHSPPLAILSLSRGDGQPGITLSRRLTDETGEWKEGATTIKRKGEALAKIQETLPLSADVAAVLLWGVQDQMTAILDAFPPDGHSLLTAAAIKGTGPDPKEVVREFDKEIGAAKKGGKEPGLLTRAAAEVKRLELELAAAQEAAGKLQELRGHFDQAKQQRDQAKEAHQQLKAKVEELARLEKLLDMAIKEAGKRTGLEEKQAGWEGLDERMTKANKVLDGLRQDAELLRRDLRVATDARLAADIQKLRLQIDTVEEAEKKCRQIREELSRTKRPEKADDKGRRELEGQVSTATSKLEASGVRYALSVESGSRTVAVSEDGAAPRKLELTGGQEETGVVGSLVVVADGIRVLAAGKEDIGALKRLSERSQAELHALFEEFGVTNARQFEQLLEEAIRLRGDLARAEGDVKAALKGASLLGLKADLQRAEEARAENAMTREDNEACRDRHLASAAEIETQLAAKKTEVRIAAGGIREQEEARPSEEDRSKLVSHLKETRRLAQNARDAFQDADQGLREPTEELLEQLRKTLDDRRDELDLSVEGLSEAEAQVTRLGADLKHAGPARALPAIESDLEEARAHCDRQQVLQEARELLKKRIEEKMDEMSAHVPLGLAGQISAHLARLTEGAFTRVDLGADLVTASVSEGRESPGNWGPHQLSCGERHQAALAIRIAVARALAESSGPVFIVLDDSCSSFDPVRLAAAEALLTDLVADGKLQVILLTCHTDWAAHWNGRAGNRVRYIELTEAATYYRQPVALAPAPV
jgi:DNA repair exonuclease SbcCD ATPase subunit